MSRLVLLLIPIVFIACSEKKYDAKIYHDFADKNFRHLDNSITLNIIPTTYPLEWNKPRYLIFSLLKNQHFFSGTKHFMGHVTTEVNCTTNNGKVREFIGQTSAEKGGFEKYLAQGYGFSILNRPQNNYSYPLLNVKGRLDYEDKVYNDYAKFLSNNLMNVMSIPVSKEDCQKALSWIQEYKKRTKTTKLAGNIYGFGADPNKYEGAGCAPMAQTILEKAGLYELAKAMDQKVYIPKTLLGNPKKNQKVSIKDLLFSSTDISEPGEDKVLFTFPDPQGLMDYFNKKRVNSKTAFILLKKESNRLVASKKNKLEVISH